MNIKAIAAAAIIAVGGLFAAEPAKAMTCGTMYSGSVTSCNEYRGTDRYGNSIYYVAFTYRSLNEEMIVSCRGRQMVQWRSYGSMSQSNAHQVAKKHWGQTHNVLSIFSF